MICDVLTILLRELLDEVEASYGKSGTFQEKPCFLLPCCGSGTLCFPRRPWHLLSASPQCAGNRLPESKSNFLKEMLVYIAYTWWLWPCTTLSASLSLQVLLWTCNGPDGKTHGIKNVTFLWLALLSRWCSIPFQVRSYNRSESSSGVAWKWGLWGVRWVEE